MLKQSRRRWAIEKKGIALKVVFIVLVMLIKTNGKNVIYMSLLQVHSLIILNMRNIKIMILLMTLVILFYDFHIVINSLFY